MTAPYVPKPSILDRLASRLFPTANYTGLLDPGQQQGLQRQGLLNVGLNLLQAGGPQAQQRGTLANIGSSIQGVNFPQMAEQALQLQAYRSQQQGQEQIQGIVGKYAAPEGETPAQRFDRLTRLTQALIGVPGAEHLLGPISNVLAQLKPPTPARARYVFKELEDPPGSGKFVMFRVNTDDPTDRIRVGVGRDPVGLTMPTEGERRAGALYTVGENAYTDLVSNFETPTLKDWLAGKAPLGLGQAWTSEDQQRRNQAGADFYRSYLYIVSGATVNPGEALEQATIIIPQLGDSPATVRQKLHGLEVKRDAMRQAMGRAGGGPKSKDPAPPGNFDEFLHP